MKHMRNETNSISVRVMQFLVNILFLLELLSKVNSFTYDLDVSIIICILISTRCNLIPILNCTCSLLASVTANIFTQIGLMIKSIFYQTPNLRAISLALFQYGVFQYQEYMQQQFSQHLSNGTIRIFPAHVVSMPLQRHVHAMQMGRCQ